MNKYFLHVGLHKTGTKFFQHKIFPNLPDDKFIYNPPRLTQLIADLMKASEEDLQVVLQAIVDEKRTLQRETDKTVVISREIMSGDLFRLYKDIQQTSSRLSSGFPEAEVICFLRYQADWLVSCYRESLHEHHYQSIESFLSLKDQEEKFVRNSYKDLNLLRIIESYLSEFDASKVNFFFFEDFKNDKELVVRRISKLLGCDAIPIINDNDKIPNRGYSAFAIRLSLIRYQLCKSLGVSRWLVHRPIYFFGQDGIPAGFSELSVLPKDKYWHEGFIKDNEEVRSKNYPNLTFYEKVKKEFSWRSFVKNRLDKFFYWDWDLLSHRRQELDEFYHRQNQELLDHFDKDQVPAIYLK